jgi:serine/threonine protein kinase HipA of HipAB toxin-antitoxin module
MYPDKATIEIFRVGRWQAAGVFRPEDFRQGYRGSSRFEYLLEYIKRDIANVVLGNKDNHARNSAVMRYEDGRVVLA